MTEFLSTLRRRASRPAVRRVLAVDEGSRQLRLLLAEATHSGATILREQSIDLIDEGLVAPEEIRSHLDGVIDEWGSPPTALLLPQHVSTSQIIELPAGPTEQIEKAVQEEALKLGGVSESRIIYDFTPAEKQAGQDRQQFWVTLCQEPEIRERIARLGLDAHDLCEVTTTANALVTAYRAVRPSSSKAILIHAGAQATVVLIIVGGQAVYASSFEMGGDFFTRTLARVRNCPEAHAERLKREANLLFGSEADVQFATAVDGWILELKRQLEDWFHAHPGSSLEGFEVAASGGAFEQRGLLEYLRARADMNVIPWPAAGAHAMAPRKGFEAAYGLALQAVGQARQPVSLLPSDLRAVWRKRLQRARIEAASTLLLLVCAVMLALGTWRQAAAAVDKQRFIEKVAAAQTAAEANESLSAELIAEYESYRPLFASQQSTLDVLKTLSQLQQARSNRSLWFVLAADQQTYFTMPGGPLNSTNKSTRMNSMPDRAGLNSQGVSTNGSAARPGMIAELCIPEDAEIARVTLSQMVKELKQQPLFSKVDLLSEDLRRDLADPSVLLTNRHYALALEFAETNHLQQVQTRKRMAPRGVPRRTTRTPDFGQVSPQSSP
jgi:Tfp pilus assembly PilM family ATPase